MSRYNKYNIKVTDRFNPLDFPKVEAEMIALTAVASTKPGTGKGQSFIDYLDDRSRKIEWISTHAPEDPPQNGNTCSTDHIEFLFDSCQGNKLFKKDLEEYIKENLG